MLFPLNGTSPEHTEFLPNIWVAPLQLYNITAGVCTVSIARFSAVEGSHVLAIFMQYETPLPLGSKLYCYIVTIKSKFRTSHFSFIVVRRKTWERLMCQPGNNPIKVHPFSDFILMPTSFYSQHLYSVKEC